MIFTIELLKSCEVIHYITSDEFNSFATNDILNITLVLLGISLTLFTVVYSFILNSKSEISKLEEIIKTNENQSITTLPYLRCEQNTIDNYIVINKYNRKLILICFINSGILFFAKLLIIKFTNIYITATLVISIVLFLYIVYYSIKSVFLVYRKYKDDIIY